MYEMNQNEIASVQNALSVTNGRAVTTSRSIAEIFGKRHDNVIRDIKSLQVPDTWRKLNFEETSFELEMPRGGTRTDKGYALTRDGFTFLAMGFTGEKAAVLKIAFLDAFNAMEQALLRGDIIVRQDQSASGSPVFDKVLEKAGIRADDLFAHAGTARAAIDQTAAASRRADCRYTLRYAGSTLHVVGAQDGEWLFLSEVIPVARVRSQFADEIPPYARKKELRKRTYGGHRGWNAMILAEAVISALRDNPHRQNSRMFADWLDANLRSRIALGNSTGAAAIEEKTTAPAEKPEAEKKNTGFTPCRLSAAFTLGLRLWMRDHNETPESISEKHRVALKPVLECLEGRMNWSLPRIEYLCGSLGAEFNALISAGSESRRAEMEAEKAALEAEQKRIAERLNALKTLY